MRFKILSVLLASCMCACSLNPSGTGDLVDASLDSGADVTATDAMEAGPFDASADVEDEPVDTTLVTAEGYCNWGFSCPPFQASFTGKYSTYSLCVNAVVSNLHDNKVSCPAPCATGLSSETCDELYQHFPDACYQGCCNSVADFTCR